MNEIGPTAGELNRMAARAYLASRGPIPGIGINDFLLWHPAHMVALSDQLYRDARAAVERREVGVIARLKRMALGDDALIP